MEAGLKDGHQRKVRALLLKLPDALEVDPVVQRRGRLVGAQGFQQRAVDPERPAVLRAGVHRLEAHGIDPAGLRQHASDRGAVARCIASGTPDALQAPRQQLAFGRELEKLELQ